MARKRREEKARRRMEWKKPPWLESLLKTKFFRSCSAHKNVKKSEENIYCVDCNRRMCTHCLIPSSTHRGHLLLQIRRYVYRSVIRIADMQNLMDCSKVQPYTVNGAKVLLLNPRRTCKPTRTNAGGTICRICGWTLTEPNRYCSLACKVSKEMDGVKASAGADHGRRTGSNQTESLFRQLTADIEASNEGSHGHCMDEFAPRAAVRRRKGIPRRAPMN